MLAQVGRESTVESFTSCGSSMNTKSCELFRFGVFAAVRGPRRALSGQ